MCSRKILLKIKPMIIELVKGKDSNLSKGDLRDLSAPQVPLKNSAKLRVPSFTLR